MKSKGTYSLVAHLNLSFFNWNVSKRIHSLRHSIQATTFECRYAKFVFLLFSIWIPYPYVNQLETASSD